MPSLEILVGRTSCKRPARLHDFASSHNIHIVASHILLGLVAYSNIKQVWRNFNNLIIELCSVAFSRIFSRLCNMGRHGTGRI